jgi:hypothetical protein
VPAVGCTGTRVTRLGEFSLMGLLFSFVSFIKKIKSSPNVRTTFSTFKDIGTYINFDENWVWLHIGLFFH